MLSKSIQRLTDQALQRARHREAWRTEVDPDPRGFDGLRGARYVLVETFRRSGEAVPTPVWFGLTEGRVFFHTAPDSGKARRLRADPRVRVAPCTARGKPLGPAVEANARFLAGEEAAVAESALAANYGRARKLYQQTVAGDGIYVELTVA